MISQLVVLISTTTFPAGFSLGRYFVTKIAPNVPWPITSELDSQIFPSENAANLQNYLAFKFCLLVKAKIRCLNAVFLRFSRQLKQLWENLAFLFGWFVIRLFSSLFPFPMIASFFVCAHVNSNESKEVPHN